MNATEEKVNEMRGKGAEENAAPRRRGRPPGSKNKPKDGTSNTSQNLSEEKPFVYHEDENQVKAAALMGSMAWYFLSKMMPVRELTEEEALQFGAALDPVLQKYLPIFGDWKYELTLVMVVYGLYETTKIRKEPVEIEHEEIKDGN